MINFKKTNQIFIIKQQTNKSSSNYGTISFHQRSYTEKKYHTPIVLATVILNTNNTTNIHTNTYTNINTIIYTHTNFITFTYTETIPYTHTKIININTITNNCTILLLLHPYFHASRFVSEAAPTKQQPTLVI